MSHFHDLRVWRAALHLATELDGVVRRLSPRHRRQFERQLMDAADSIVYNISESTGRKGLRDQIRMLYIARGSAREVESQIFTAHQRQAIPTSEFVRLHRRIRGVQQLLDGYIRYKSRQLGLEE